MCACSCMYYALAVMGAQGCLKGGRELLCWVAASSEAATAMLSSCTHIDSRCSVFFQLAFVAASSNPSPGPTSAW